MVGNTLDEYTKSGGGFENGREQGEGPWEAMSLCHLQNIVETGLLMRINCGGSSSPTRSRYATTEAVIDKKLQAGIADELRGF